MKGNPTYKKILSAMKAFDHHGMPESFDFSKVYFLAHPQTGATYPPKAIWGLATGFKSGDFDAPSAKRWLEKKGFYVHDIRLEKTPETLNEQVQKSGADPRPARKARLATAPKIPKSALVLVRRFLRNPDVIAERLCLAAGKCESCGKDAPFVRASNGTPFLEVHHVTPLADDGEDSVDNTRALCPNCHRKAHYG